MSCEACKTRQATPNKAVCDICATFADESYDLNYALSVQRSRAQSWDDLNAEIEFNWREKARQSREAISAKFPPRKVLTK